MPNITLPPLCHPLFKSGPPSEAAQTASHFLNEVITNSKLVKLEDLCIVEGQHVWVLYIDLTCLNFGGNILDVSIKALTSALNSLKMPKVTILEQETPSTSEEQQSVEIKVSPEERQPLKLGPIPLSCTVSLFGDKYLLDPTDEEEELADANVTVVLNADREVVHIHKPGGVAIAPERLQQCVNLSKKQAKVIQKLIESAAKVNL